MRASLKLPVPSPAAPNPSKVLLLGPPNTTPIVPVTPPTPLQPDLSHLSPGSCKPLRMWVRPTYLGCPPLPSPKAAEGVFNSTSRATQPCVLGARTPSPHVLRQGPLRLPVRLRTLCDPAAGPPALSGPHPSQRISRGGFTYPRGTSHSQNQNCVMFIFKHERRVFILMAREGRVREGGWRDARGSRLLGEGQRTGGG